MKLLCIDTATDHQSIAVMDGTSVVAHSSILRRGGHGPGILDDMHALLEDAQLTAGQMDGYVVGLGPGSFTGLRISLATLKGLALAFGKPIYGARTSQILLSAAEASDPVAVIDARRGEVYLEGGHLPAPVCCGPDDIWHHVGTEKAWCFVGDGALKYAHDIGNPGHPYLIPKEDAIHRPQARYLVQHIDTKMPAQLASLEPIYVRKSDAEINYPDGFPNAAQRLSNRS